MRPAPGLAGSASIAADSWTGPRSSSALSQRQRRLRGLRRPKTGAGQLASSFRSTSGTVIFCAVEQPSELVPEHLLALDQRVGDALDAARLAATRWYAAT